MTVFLILEHIWSLELSYRDYMWRLYFESIDRYDLKCVITHRITMLQTDELYQLLPSNDFFEVTTIVNHVNNPHIFFY